MNKPMPFHKMRKCGEESGKGCGKMFNAVRRGTIGYTNYCKECTNRKAWTR